MARMFIAMKKKVRIIITGFFLEQNSLYRLNFSKK